MFDWANVMSCCVLIAGSVLIGFVINMILFAIFDRIALRAPAIPAKCFSKHLKWPACWLVVLAVLGFGLEYAPALNESTKTTHLMSMIAIAAVGWLIVKLVYVLEDILLLRYDMNVADNLRARKIHTQLRIVKRIFSVIVMILASALILMTFPKIRQLGTTILASAGIAGIIIGMAAQRALSNFIAGLQIAFTGPLNIDDVVIVEGEWGRIEEITLTYVVVRIWDQRRLIVPISHFVEKSFQNWTRVTADILGTVFLYTDYTVDVEKVRAELERIVKEQKEWDSKVCVLQVTNATERTLELRALMSAANASDAWTMRCNVREKLVEFLQKKYPNALPKVRAELDGAKEK